MLDSANPEVHMPEHIGKRGYIIPKMNAGASRKTSSSQIVTAIDIPLQT